MSDIRKRNEALNRRWEVRVSSRAAFRQFRVRADHFLRMMVDWSALEKTAEDRFALVLGLWPRAFQGSDILKTLGSADSLADYLVVCQQAVWALDESGAGQVAEFVGAIDRARDMSLGIDFRIVTKKGVPLFAPAGAKLLDDVLVSEPLGWLSGHGTIADRYAQALAIALQKDESKFSHAFDSLRWSLEQLLRALFRNRKALEKQEAVLLPWLKDRGVHQQIVNMYRDILRRFTEYQNDAVKHGDGWVPAELEFMIYLTGAFMRLLLQLDAQNASPTQ